MKKRVALVAMVVLSILLGTGAVSAQEEPAVLPKLHVAQILLQGMEAPNDWNRVVGTVWVVDEQGTPVPDAQVYIHAWKPIKVAVFGMHATKADGRVAWTMNSPLNGYWTLCVVGIVKWGYLYDPEANSETCDLIWYQ